MMTFEHTTPKGEPADRPPSILPEIVLVVCAILLLPFTLVGLLFWGIGKIAMAWYSERGGPKNDDYSQSLTRSRSQAGNLSSR